jgi:hypothetical protein
LAVKQRAIDCYSLMLWNLLADDTQNDWRRSFLWYSIFCGTVPCKIDCICSTDDTKCSISTATPNVEYPLRSLDGRHQKWLATICSVVQYIVNPLCSLDRWHQT